MSVQNLDQTGTEEQTYTSTDDSSTFSSELATLSEEALEARIFQLRQKLKQTIFAPLATTSVNDPAAGSWQLASTSGQTINEHFNTIMRAVDTRISERQEEYQKANEKSQRELERKLNKKIRTANKRIKTMEQKIKTMLPPPQILNKQFSDMSDPDFEYIVRHQEEIAEFEGQYIAVSGGKIVGKGKTPKEALDEAEKIDKDADPLIHFVPRRGFNV